MNPSALGWIKKITTLLPECTFLSLNSEAFYKLLKRNGFIYGSNVSNLCSVIKADGFNEEEHCKINLTSAFYYIHQSKNCTTDFIDSVIEFYKAIDEHKRSFLADLFGEPSSSRLLEKIIHKRIHIDDNIITKNFNYFLVNAFLFIDVIGYQYYLNGGTTPKHYINTFESVLENIVFTVLDSKSVKTEYDKNLIKLFEVSLRQKNNTDFNANASILSITNPLEKWYIIDIVCMASWSDKHIEKSEYLYLNQLRKNLNISENIIINAVDDINKFYKENKHHIAFLTSKNLAQNFYDNSSSFVIRLIRRNSKRLIIELSQSKEALTLLAKSTHTNLTDEEQKKVQNQLLDIFKSIPSLAIFLLPGGMLLLPLFVKLIPKLLPSAFDENRIEED